MKDVSADVSRWEVRESKLDLRTLWGRQNKIRKEKRRETHCTCKIFGFSVSHYWQHLLIHFCQSKIVEYFHEMSSGQVFRIPQGHLPQSLPFVINGNLDGLTLTSLRRHSIGDWESPPPLALTYTWFGFMVDWERYIYR